MGENTIFEYVLLFDFLTSNNLLQVHFAKHFMLNRICNIDGISKATFYRYQNFVPVVEQYWLSQQQSVIASLSGKSVVLAGDGWSPSNSATFCSYTLMDTTTEVVMNTTTVEREVGRKFQGLTEVTQRGRL